MLFTMSLSTGRGMAAEPVGLAMDSINEHVVAGHAARCSLKWLYGRADQRDGRGTRWASDGQYQRAQNRYLRAAGYLESPVHPNVLDYVRHFSRFEQFDIPVDA